VSFSPGGSINTPLHFCCSFLGGITVLLVLMMYNLSMFPPRPKVGSCEFEHIVVNIYVKLTWHLSCALYCVSFTTNTLTVTCVNGIAQFYLPLAHLSDLSTYKISRTCVYSPATVRHCTFASSHFHSVYGRRLRCPGWSDLTLGWMDVWRWSPPNTNQAAVRRLPSAVCTYCYTSIRCLVVRPFLWPPRWPGTCYQTTCEIRHVPSTVFAVTWKLLFSRFSSVHSALEALRLCAI